ncbi:MAG: GNAT family N-acetyltransferase [Gammaproteobacteria bacterium]|nr:GNAT family N-acetyltransferase [Gammaproteobacteria bacterium]
MANAPRIRLACGDDTEALRELYRAAVLTTAAPFYTAAQIAAWAGFADDAAAFTAWIEAASTWVAADAAHDIVGFTGLASDTPPGHGHLTALYVAPSAMRRGLGTRLLDVVIDAAAANGRSVLTTHASTVSRPLFERAGFRLVEVQRSPHGGVEFVRWWMRREG